MTNEPERCGRTECAFQAGYIRGQQDAMKDVITLQSVCDALEEAAPWLLAHALVLPLGIRLVAVWVIELPAVADAAGVLFLSLGAVAAAGWSLRIWRWLKGGASEGNRQADN